VCIFICDICDSSRVTCNDKNIIQRLVYIQSHDPQVIGTIPAGVTDDVDDGGGISEPSDVCCQTTDPLSHTPVS
jgi:hypothetical protein